MSTAIKEGADDEQLVSFLSSAQTSIELHNALEECLRAGFVELSSAKFSKAFNASARDLTPANYPVFGDEFADETDGDNGGEPRAAKNIRLLVDESMLDATGGDLATCIRGMQLCSLAKEDEKETTFDEAQVTQNEENIGLRKRKGVTTDKSNGETNLVTENEASTGATKFTNRTDDHVQRWIGIRPRGPLAKSCQAFERALGIAVELAALNLRIQQESASGSL